jgi:hypothetical protein
MRTVLRFTAFVCLIAAGGSVLWGFLYNPALLGGAILSFLMGIVLLCLSAILDRLARLELLLTCSRGAAPDRVRTQVGDFELLGPVAGEATCLACRKIAPKSGLYYNKAMDVYYHPQCLAHDRAG